MTRRIALAVTAAALGAGGLTAGPAAAHSFDGSCTFDGIVHDDPAVTLLPKPSRFHYAAAGSCTGTLDGVAQPAGGVPVDVDETADELAGCVATVTPAFTMPVRFHPRRGRPRTLRLRIDTDLFAGPLGLFTGGGARGGALVGSGQLQGDANSLAACVAGASGPVGLRLSLQTLGTVTG